VKRSLFHVKHRMFCWHCGGDLGEKDGKLIFTEVTLPGGNVVKVHKVCEDRAKAFMHFDTTPGRGEFAPSGKGSINTRHCPVCGSELPDYWSWSYCPAHQPGAYE
jgi:hypothetical protein